jgi:hypothetical protein
VQEHHNEPPSNILPVLEKLIYEMPESNEPFISANLIRSGENSPMLRSDDKYEEESKHMPHMQREVVLLDMDKGIESDFMVPPCEFICIHVDAKTMQKRQAILSIKDGVIKIKIEKDIQFKFFRNILKSLKIDTTQEISYRDAKIEQT